MEVEVICNQCKKPNSDSKYKYCSECREKERIKKSRSRSRSKSRSKSRSPSPVRYSSEKKENRKAEDVSLIQTSTTDSERAELEKRLFQSICRLFMLEEYFKDEIPKSFWTLENMITFLDVLKSNTEWDWENKTEIMTTNALQKMRILGPEKYSKRNKLFSKPVKKWTMGDLNQFFLRFFDPNKYNCNSDPKLMNITGEEYFSDLRFFCVFQYKGENTEPILIKREILERNTQYNKILHNYKTLRDKQEWGEWEDIEAEQELKKNPRYMTPEEKRRKKEYEKLMEEEDRKRLDNRKKLQAQADEINAKRAKKPEKKRTYNESRSDSDEKEKICQKKSTMKKKDQKFDQEYECDEEYEAKKILKKNVPPSLLYKLK